MVVLNGAIKDLSNDTCSDLNYVTPGTSGAVRGLNTLEVHDAPGNTEIVAFTVD